VSPTPLAWYLGLSAVLFTVGVLGVLVRRNVIIIFMAIEIMLNAVNLAFVAFAPQPRLDGRQVMVFFVMTVAAAEAAVGLAIILAIFRSRGTTNADELVSQMVSETSALRWMIALPAMGSSFTSSSAGAAGVRHGGRPGVLWRRHSGVATRRAPHLRLAPGAASSMGLHLIGCRSLSGPSGRCASTRSPPSWRSS